MHRSVGDHAHQRDGGKGGHVHVSRAARRSKADPIAALFPGSGAHVAEAQEASVDDSDARLAALFAAPSAAGTVPPESYAESGIRSGGGAPRTPARTAAGRRARVWWWAGAAAVLVAGLVVAAIFVVPLLAENARVADARTVCVSAAHSATSADAAWQTALATYTHTADTARADAAAAEPALAALQGMSDQGMLDAAIAARVALVTALDQAVVPTAPEAFAVRDVEAVTDLDELAAATSAARDHATQVAAARTELRQVQASVVPLDTAFAEAFLALGSSLPAAAGGIVDQNPAADQASKDAVVAAADAVVAIQETGVLGDPEMLAYANAVTVLRQASAAAEE